MFQQDHSEIALRSSEPVYRSTEGPLPLWLQGWRAVGTVVSAAATAIARIVEGLERRHREAVTVRELSALRDRELRDIGIERGDIRLIARAMAHDEADPRKHNTAGRPWQGNVASFPRQTPLQPCCG